MARVANMAKVHCRKHGKYTVRSQLVTHCGGVSQLAVFLLAIPAHYLAKLAKDAKTRRVQRELGFQSRQRCQVASVLQKLLCFIAF